MTKQIDLLIAVDPVPFPQFPPFPPTEDPWVLPPNVEHAIGLRTLNQPNFLVYPYGRRIAAHPGATTNIRQVIFAKDTDNLNGPLERWVKDAKVDHTDIDNHPVTMQETVDSIGRLAKEKPRLAIVLCTGNFTQSFPHDGAGMYDIEEALWKLYPDRRKVLVHPTVPHDCDMVKVMKRIKEFKPEAVAYVGHSHGIGEAAPKFAAMLAAA